MVPQKTLASRLLRYGVAVLLPILALCLRWLLLPFFGSTVPYLLFFPAIAVSAWFGRLGPGLLATALSGALSYYFILLPAGSLSIDKPGDLFSLSFFLMIGVLISVLHESVHRANQKIAAARQEAEAANQAKDHFVAVAAHELRSPIQTILSWSDLLLKGELDAETQQQALQVICRNAWSQNQIISDLMEMSRLTSGNIRLETAPLDLLPLVTTAIEDVHPAAEGKSIRIDLVATPALEPVLGDTDRLRQVMLNLLGNAVKFTPEGGHITVRLEREDEQNLIKVSDTGMGIKPNFLPYVFDSYQQHDWSSPRKHKGLGLGLSIVKQLVTMHGGSVQVESDGEGKGATFTVRLPIHAASVLTGET